MAAARHWLSFDAARTDMWGIQTWSRNERMISCYLGKIYHVWSHRNAWWGFSSDPWGVRTRSSCCGEFVFVNQAAE
jgi:hypothetical protein